MRHEYMLVMGKGGDCLRASIASILEVPTASLPHYSSLDGDQISCWNEYLAPANLCIKPAYGFPYDYYIAGVDYGGGVTHACVGKGNGICHDPAPGTSDFSDYKIVFKLEIALADRSKPRELAALGLA